jgi:hypothetical protein
MRAYEAKTDIEFPNARRALPRQLTTGHSGGPSDRRICAPRWPIGVRPKRAGSARGLMLRFIVDARFIPILGECDTGQVSDKRNMGHVHSAPCRPQTQGKIERSHQTPDNLATWKSRSTSSSTMTSIAVIARAWAISNWPTSTSDAPKTSCLNEKG